MTAQTSDDSDTLAPRRRDLPAAVWTLVLARAVNRLGAFTLAFLAVVLVDGLGASVATAGLVVAAFGVATIPSRLAGGALADRLGRVPTICLGLVGCAVAQLGIAASQTLGWAVAGAVALGLAFELYEPPSQALVADLTTDAERPLAYGLLAAALAAAGAAAGLLAVVLGALDLRLLLVADAITCLAAAALVALLVRDPGGADGPVGRGTAQASPWRDHRLLALLAAGTGFALVYMTVVVCLPLAVAARGLPAEEAGLVLTASALTVVAAQPVLRWRVLAGDGFRAMTVGYVVLAAGLAATAPATSIAGFVAAAVLWSVGDLLLMGHAWTIVSRIAPSGSRGAYLAAYGLSWGVATVVAPLLGSQLLARTGPAGLWCVLGGASLALAAAQPALARCVRGPVPVPARGEPRVSAARRRPRA